MSYTMSERLWIELTVLLAFFLFSGLLVVLFRRKFTYRQLESYFLLSALAAVILFAICVGVN
jgi:hypothetical protein